MGRNRKAESFAVLEKRKGEKMKNKISKIIRRTKLALSLMGYYELSGGCGKELSNTSEWKMLKDKLDELEQEILVSKDVFGYNAICTFEGISKIKVIKTSYKTLRIELADDIDFPERIEINKEGDIIILERINKSI